MPCQRYVPPGYEKAFAYLKATVEPLLTESSHTGRSPHKKARSMLRAI